MVTDIGEALTQHGYAVPAAGTQSAAQRVYDELRRRIINLDLPPNMVLSRSGLAREYAVSQTPIRDALQKLEAEGLVDIFPQSRTVVTRLVTAEIYEAHFLRIAVETEAMRRLAPECDASVVKRLRTLIALQEALAENTDEITAFQELDEAFHVTLLVAAGQPGLVNLMKARTGHLNRLRRLDMPIAGKVQRIMREHREIADALEARDAEAAQAAIRRHLSQTVGRVEILRAERPDYFA